MVWDMNECLQSAHSRIRSMVYKSPTATASRNVNPTSHFTQTWLTLRNAPTSVLDTSVLNTSPILLTKASLSLFRVPSTIIDINALII